MINVKPDVIAALESALPDASVTSERPRKNGTLPAVTITEENNAVALWTDNRERLSRVRFRVDIWNTSSTAEAAEAVDAAMAGLGFVRIGAQDVPEDDYKHRQHRYEATIAAVGKRYVYH